MKIYSVNHKKFKRYGRVLNLNCDEIIKDAAAIELPSEGSAYEPSAELFEKYAEGFSLENYGGLPVQVGYCYGHNSVLGALEWHKSPEINIAVTDFVLILGKTEDITEKGYDSKNCEMFYVNAGECIEIFAETMHFCPCETEKSGFGCIVVLPLGTNTLHDKKPEDKKIFKKNKWLIAHNDNAGLIEKGVAPGIYGENYEIKY